MAYADALDPATPAGNQDLGLGDDRIRELKRALRQRWATLVVDIDADPLVLLPNVVPGTSLVDASITKPKMAADSVDTAQILDNAILNAKVKDDELLVAKLKSAFGLGATSIAGIHEGVHTNVALVNIAAGAGYGISIVAPTVLNDYVMIGWPPLIGLMMQAFVGGAGQINLIFYNYSGAPQTIPALTDFKWAIIKRLGV